MKAPLRVVFMGTPEFSVPCLRALHSSPDLANILAVYTQPDRPAGRGQKIHKPAVKIFAEENKIPVLQPENINTPEESRRLSSFMADVFVVVAYAQLLKPGVLNLPRIFCLNVHASLLPKYRGAAPIQYSILKGDLETGITTMKMVSKLDAGPMIHKKSIPLHSDLTTIELQNKLSLLGAETLIETMQMLQSGDFKEVPQNDQDATYAPSLKKTDGHILWNESAVEINRKIRALNPWPGTYTNSSKGLIKILKATPIETIAGTPPDAKCGDLFTRTGKLIVRCKNDWLEIQELQPENKPKMQANDFLNGIRNSPQFHFLGVS